MVSSAIPLQDSSRPHTACMRDVPACLLFTLTANAEQAISTTAASYSVLEHCQFFDGGSVRVREQGGAVTTWRTGCDQLLLLCTDCVENMAAHSMTE